MQALPKFRTSFNSKLYISHSGGKLSSDSDLILVKELMSKLKFFQVVQSIVHFNDNRRYHRYNNSQLLEQIILQLIAGYNTDQVAQTLRTDPTFKSLTGLSQLVS